MSLFLLSIFPKKNNGFGVSSNLIYIYLHNRCNASSYMKGTGSNQLGWNAGFSQCTTGGAVNDVDFTRAVALWMLENLCVDPARLFAAGFSNGGSMTFNLTCTMSDTFAGFSFVGSTQPPSTYPSEPTVSVWRYHSTSKYHTSIVFFLFGISIPDQLPVHSRCITISTHTHARSFSHSAGEMANL